LIISVEVLYRPVVGLFARRGEKAARHLTHFAVVRNALAAFAAAVAGICTGAFNRIGTSHFKPSGILLYIPIIVKRRFPFNLRILLLRISRRNRLFLCFIFAGTVFVNVKSAMLRPQISGLITAREP